MLRYPFITLRQAIVVLRIVTPLLFMAHAAVRIVNWSIPQFALFMESVGFPNGVLVVWCITITELVAGALMIAGYGVRWMAALLFAIAAGGIVLIHGNLGWLVGEHGTGGSEYSVALLVMLLVVAAADGKTTAGTPT